MAEFLGAEAMESRECTDALDDEGYVLALASTGKVAKCAANGAVYGVGYKSTKNPVTGTAEANKQVAIIRAPKQAYVQYAIQNTDSADLAIGELVSMQGAAASGCVKRHVSTAWPGTYAAATAETIDDEHSRIVGISLEAVARPGAGTKTGKLLCQLLCPIPIKQ